MVIPSQAPQQQLPSSASSGSNYYYVGAQAPSSACSPTCAPVFNTGAETQVQVVSQQVTGCLSYWVGDDSQANIWGQVGYYICDGSSPVAFYQVWNLNTSSVLTTGTTTVSAGSHFFSMYLEYGTVWAFALDGTVFGTQDMQSSISSSTHPVQAVNEEGEVSAPWNPAQVQFGTTMQIEQSGVWTPVASASEPWGCGTSAQSCWGVQGGSQNSALPADDVVVGGSAPTLALGSTLWNGATSSATTTAATTTTTTTSSTSSSVANRAVTVSLTVIPPVNMQKSSEYFTVQATDQNGNPVSGASVSLTVTSPAGKSYTASGMTNTNGLAYLRYVLSASAPMGRYQVSAVVMAAGYPLGMANGSFMIV
ncbi:MAG: hypothetical protein ACLQEQ_07015 [Nitrososphaerales archaeon]